MPPHSQAVYEQVIEGKVATLGREHADTLSTKGNYAIVLEDQGKLTEAEQVYEEVIVGKSEALGAGHVDTLMSMVNLGNLLLDRASKFEAQAEMFEEAAGAGLATGRNGKEAAQAYLTQRVAMDMEKARPLFEEAVTGFMDSLGPKHTHTQVRFPCSPV